MIKYSNISITENNANPSIITATSVFTISLLFYDANIWININTSKSVNVFYQKGTSLAGNTLKSSSFIYSIFCSLGCSSQP